MSQQWKLGIIGCGNMGSALVRGVLASGLLGSKNVFATDVERSRTEGLASQLGIATARDNREVLQRADTIILAVKPQTMLQVLCEIAPAVQPHHLFISIAAGIPLAVLARSLGAAARLIRAMPNTPALIGCGAAALAKGGGAGSDDIERALAIFRSVGVAVEVPEALLDAVTALSGSGPAYVFHFIECLTRSGEAMGLPRETAELLTRQTVLGAARMVCETGEEPAELRRRVTSPGGTTEAALRVFDEGDLAGLIEGALKRARERARELGSQTM